MTIGGELNGQQDQRKERRLQYSLKSKLTTFHFKWRPTRQSAESSLSLYAGPGSWLCFPPAATILTWHRDEVLVKRLSATGKRRQRNTGKQGLNSAETKLTTWHTGQPQSFSPSQAYLTTRVPSVLWAKIWIGFSEPTLGLPVLLSPDAQFIVW